MAIWDEIKKHAQNIHNAAQNLLSGDNKVALKDLGMTEHI